MAGGENVLQWAGSRFEKAKEGGLVTKFLRIQHGPDGGFEGDRGVGNEEEETNVRTDDSEEDRQGIRT